MCDSNTNYYKQLILNDLNAAMSAMSSTFRKTADGTLPINRSIARTQAIPKLYNAKAVADFKEIAEYTHAILTKIIDRYIDNPNFRNKFGFDPQLTDLMLQPSGYTTSLPMARVDIFYNEETGDFKFCEFNTDGTSAMNEDRELVAGMQANATFQAFSNENPCQPFELFDSWVEQVKAIYTDYLRGVGNQQLDAHAADNSAKMFHNAQPHVAIVDFTSKASLAEFKIFVEAFERNGFTAEICDIEQLTYRQTSDSESILATKAQTGTTTNAQTGTTTNAQTGTTTNAQTGELFSPSGRKIDIIYRRAVTCDIMANIEKLDAFVNAIKHNACCLIGALKTQTAHNKILFELMSDPRELEFLTSDERAFLRAHVPQTYRLTHDNTLIDLNAVHTNKDAWIIKPLDSYGSNNVYAGRLCTQSQWDEALSFALSTNGGFILQEFCTPYITENIDFVDGYANSGPVATSAQAAQASETKTTGEISKEILRQITSKCYNLTGLYVYNGKFAGIYSRVSKTPVIDSKNSEIALASFAVEEKSSS